MQRIAAIDAGSNAMRLIVGDINDSWNISLLENVRLPVRLGTDVFSTGVIQEQTMQQAVEAFLHFRRVADAFGVGRIRAVATSAMREAQNRDILQDRISRNCGVEVEIISAAEEARLIHLAVANSVNLRKKRAVLVDIGGGSVEVTLSHDSRIVSTESYNAGTVRLLQSLDGRQRSGMPVDRSFGPLVREYAEAARRRIDREIGKAPVELCVGTGGNVEDLGRLHQRYFQKRDDRLITMRELRDLIEELNGMSIQQRIRKFKLRPDRADVILPAAILLHLIAREAGVRQIAIPHVGLKDGVLLDLVDQLRRGPHPPRREQVWASAMQLGERFRFDASHAVLTARLAGQLFDQTIALHGLGPEERLLLELAALLHDIGHAINAIDHDQHGYYILKANPLIGLSEHQQEVVARLILYHRKSSSVLDEEAFKSLPQGERIALGKLIALLRLADGLDVSHASHVTSAKLFEKNKRWSLTLHGQGDLMIEKWALDKRRSLFEGMFGVHLELEEARS